MNQGKVNSVSSSATLNAGGDKWLKRTANSEEELSEGSSSSGSNPKGQMDAKHNKDNSKRGRPARRSASKRKWSDDSKSNEELDADWNADDVGLDNSSDSDPVWSPGSKQRNGKVTPPIPVKSQRAGRKPKGWSPPQNHTQTVLQSPVKGKDGSTNSTNSDFSISLNGLELRLSFSGFVGDASSEPTFESGKFIMLKSDFKRQKNPCLWRIDGKNLLQKYEPILYKGSIAFRNISTYSSWTPNNQGLYIPVDTEFAFQSKAETVVRFNPDTVKLPVGSEIAARINQESLDIQDSFQIYLQTLISQALDSNFLTEIAKENDEYFLASISTVEDQWVSPRITAVKEKRKWPQHLYETMEFYPIFELNSVTSGEKCCASCGGRNPTRKLTFQTVMYQYETLKMTDSNQSVQTHLLCLACTDGALLYHQLFHFRYNLFTGCTTKIKEMNVQNSEADGPTILKACLADQQWTSDMLRQASLILAEAEQYIS